MGTIQGVKDKIIALLKAQPCFFKLRYTLLRAGLSETELERLVQAKIITLMQFSAWSAPIVPVIKADGNSQVCGEYKVNVAKPQIY